MGRFINSQERLGDCNLLGDPASRDLAEAADDYRRAMSRVHRLPTTRRISLQAQLFYKQALAYALPSPVQDCELALEMCHHADQILEDEGKNSTGLLLALQTLTTPTVEMLANASGQSVLTQVQSRQVMTTEKPSDKNTPKLSATEKMRSAILTLRDLAGPSAHRDQLELMMFSARNLIEFGEEPSRMRQSGDVELLLSLSRLALNRGNRRADDDAVHLGSQSFLRQYYDTAFAASLATTPSDAKRLLEIQHEATTGTRYGKAHIGLAVDSALSEPQPVLAIYRMADAAYLVCDCPRSKGSCVLLDDICTPDELTSACEHEATLKMRLPSEVSRKLEAFFATSSPRCGISLQHRDPVTMLGYAVLTETSAKFDEAGNRKNPVTPNATKLTAIGKFPFQIPSNWLPERSVDQSVHEQ